MFGDNLKKIRTNKNISQQQLANELSVSQQAVAKWECNTASPNPGMIAKISKYFNVSTDFLLGQRSTKKKVDPISDDDIKAALFGDDSDATDEMLEAVRSYAAFLSERQKKKNAGADGKNDDKNK